MRESLEKGLKIIGIVLGVLFLLAGVAFGMLLYEMYYKKTEIGQEQSADGAYALTIMQIGEPGFPFGPVDGRFTLQKDGETINTRTFTVNNDGVGLDYEDFVLFWKEDCVRIRVSGSEQEDVMYTLYYNGDSEGEAAGPWFTDEEVISLVQETYGEQVSYVNTEAAGYYVFRTEVDLPEEGTFEFYVEQGRGILPDNYLDAYYKYICDSFFEKSNDGLRKASHLPAIHEH